MNVSYWMKNKKNTISYPALEKECDCDVLIIGGGISGISTAYYLAETGNDVILLEADCIGYGASGRNTGKVSAQHGIVYHELIEKHGKEMAQLYYESHQKAIDAIEQLVATYDIDCDFKRCDTLLYTEEKQQVPLYQKEYEAYETLHIPSSYISSHQDYPQLQAGLQMKHQAVFDPYSFVVQFSKVVSEKGVSIYEHSPVSELSKTEDGLYKVSVNGTFVHARYVILATQYPIVDYGNLYFSYMYCEQQTLYTAKQKKTDRMVSLSTDTYPISIGNHQDKHIIACKSHRNGYEPNFRFPSSFHTMIPNQLQTPWTSSDFVSIDHLPLIGKLEKYNDQLLFASGFSKWGNTTGIVAGKILASCVQNKPSSLRMLFSPQRKKGTFSWNYVKLNLQNAAMFFRSRWIHMDDEMPEKEEGKPVWINHHIYGAYRDEKDELFIVDITCPHAGCIAQFNKEDKSWDCPCHGSRFTYKGDIIKGPATCSLSSIHEDKNKCDPHVIR